MIKKQNHEAKEIIITDKQKERLRNAFGVGSGMSYAILTDGNNVKPIDDCLVWAEWKAANRHKWVIKQERVDGLENVEAAWNGNNIPFVSTVFLGINHAFGTGEPLWFETMVFNGPLKSYQARSSTYEQALLEHDEAMRKARQAELGVFDKEE